MFIWFQATVLDFEPVLHHLGYCKPKEVIPRAWNASLSFGNVFNIKVSGYKMVFIQFIYFDNFCIIFVI